MGGEVGGGGGRVMPAQRESEKYLFGHSFV